MPDRPGLGRRADSVDSGPGHHRTRPTARRQLQRTHRRDGLREIPAARPVPRRGVASDASDTPTPGPSSALAGLARRRASSPDNRRVLYPEWRRDRPVDATTTYRRDVGKVPSPGRSSCEIRDTPFGAPSKRPGRPVHRPRPRRLSTIRSCLCRTEPCRRQRARRPRACRRVLRRSRDPPGAPCSPGSWRSASWSSTARWARCSRRTSSTRRRSAATGSAIIPKTCAATTIS